MGIFTVKSEHFSEVHIMLMENTMQIKDPKQLKYVFDLKGSTVDRSVTGETKTSTTLKDVNFLIAKKKFRNLTRLDNETTRRLV